MVHSYYQLPDSIEEVIRIAESGLNPRNVLMGEVDPRRVASRLVGEIRHLQIEVARLKRAKVPPEERSDHAFDALVLVRQWMDGMPLTKEEVRGTIETAIKAADSRGVER